MLFNQYDLDCLSRASYPMAASLLRKDDFADISGDLLGYNAFGDAIQIV